MNLPSESVHYVLKGRRVWYSRVEGDIGQPVAGARSNLERAPPSGSAASVAGMSGVSARMDVGFVERLISLVEQSRLTELQYVENGTRVRIAREAAAGASGPGQPSDVPTPPVSGKVALAPRAIPPDDAGERADHVVTAGMSATFFRAPGPGQAPFVSEGDTVGEGQTLALLEAMKTLNPVEADRAGRVLRILVENGASVRAGTPLFKIALAV